MAIALKGNKLTTNEKVKIVKFFRMQERIQLYHEMEL
jgi:hypothetical protein